MDKIAGQDFAKHAFRLNLRAMHTYAPLRKPPGHEGSLVTRPCMTRNDKSTFYQPFSMTLVPMQDTMRHWFFSQSHRKVTAPARQTPRSGAEEGR